MCVSEHFPDVNNREGLWWEQMPYAVRAKRVHTISKTLLLLLWNAFAQWKQCICTECETCLHEVNNLLTVCSVCEALSHYGNKVLPCWTLGHIASGLLGHTKLIPFFSLPTKYRYLETDQTHTGFKIENSSTAEGMSEGFSLPHGEDRIAKARGTGRCEVIIPPCDAKQACTQKKQEQTTYLMTQPGLALPSSNVYNF